jgi:putative colanic acid biosynthesis acetyltransferase WcaF
VTILDAKQTTPITGGPSFTLANRVERALWGISWLLLARWTPPMLSPWRILLLKLFGASVAPGAAIAANVSVWLPRHLTLGAHCVLGPGVDCYNMAPIAVGARTVVSQRAYLCAGSHDVGDENFQLIAKPIVIGEDCWIAAEAFIAPGVCVEDGVVVAARACAFERLEAWKIYRGNPAVCVRERPRRRTSRGARAE